MLHIESIVMVSTGRGAFLRRGMKFVLVCASVFWHLFHGTDLLFLVAYTLYELLLVYVCYNWHHLMPLSSFSDCLSKRSAFAGPGH